MNGMPVQGRPAEPGGRVVTLLCRNRRVVMPRDECLERYVEANAFNRRRTMCFHCLQGLRVRREFAGQE